MASSVTTDSYLSRAFIPSLSWHLVLVFLASSFSLPLSPSIVRVLPLRSGPFLQTLCHSHLSNHHFLIFQLCGVAPPKTLCLNSQLTPSARLPSQLHRISPLSYSPQWLFPTFCLIKQLFSSLSFSFLTDGTIAYFSESRNFRGDHFFYLCGLQAKPSHHSLVSSAAVASQLTGHPASILFSS